MLQAVLEGQEDPQHLDAITRPLLTGPKPVVPFHWHVEFPEIFSRDNPGFDAFVGNPPFLGGKRISTIHGDPYRDWLSGLHDGASSNADLVSHFFRRAFELSRRAGTFGLIATKTISQGDTRASGLRWICTHGGTIYAARKRVKWPAAAAVMVSVVHVSKRAEPSICVLDDRAVPRITAFLFHAGAHEDPLRLVANAGRSYVGSVVLGMGFTFDDASTEATTLAQMHELLSTDPRNRERIFPFIGGEEVNESPDHAPRRFIIDFDDMALEEAAQWPDLLAVVRAKVKPHRDTVKRAAYRERWWRYAERQTALYESMRGVHQVLVNAQVSQHLCFAMQPTDRVFAHTLNVFISDRLALFASLQSRPHEIWARFFASSLEDRLRYTPSDCFETFPLPEGWEHSATLEATGQRYYDLRAQLMLEKREGLTRIYNRFNDPNEDDPRILTLRELHDAMDRAVLDAYDWNDLRPTCQFLMEGEVATEDADGSPANAKRRWRYRWVDDVRDETLARLLALNAERARGSDTASGGEATAPTRPENGA